MSELAGSTFSANTRCGASAFLACALTCCIAEQQDVSGSVKGEYIGTFQVKAVLSDTSCGDGEIAAPGTWDFEVILSIDESCVYWNTGRVPVCGSISANGDGFLVQTLDAVIMSEPSTSSAGCVIWRRDTASGLWEPPAAARHSFAGTLTFEFAQETASQCESVLVGLGVPRLPCEAHYDMNALRRAE